ncbi:MULTISPECIES: DUF3902 family protein [Bacillus amyloliquefaciens group]|uniref:DUF3902 family protein n=1 Tax=Bacillus amyloliquefaciens group TaxID=1938374 RepID=UPI00057C0F78|nr:MULTISPECIES: DUF3902 family protein [Bacillus amyloliquefaciens group]AZJ44547.1 DUF3902 family protein [Bacillus velezensis]MEB3984783.1 DUF3902 family protein [Bacillus velezensis]POR14938.1 hypothetical protein B9W23_07245 [Bacillus velezensis]QCE18550.1 DUF3902 family protein [Bacillus velezensis]UFK58745.1 DUF3902 family protein [Bacillus amyloliquefaciens]
MISVFVNIFKNEIGIKICRQSGEAYRIKGVIRCMTVPKNKTYEERNSNLKSNLVSFLLALSGFIFSIYMQSMAYWSNDSMLWYWVGAVLSYLFAAGSMVTLILNKNKDSILTISCLILMIVTVMLILVTTFWTTFIIIAWQSGM